MGSPHTNQQFIKGIKEAFLPNGYPEPSDYFKALKEADERKFEEQILGVPIDKDEHRRIREQYIPSSKLITYRILASSAMKIVSLAVFIGLVWHIVARFGAI